MVRVKGRGSLTKKAYRALLVKIRGDIENQIRGVLRNRDLVIGRAKRSTFTALTHQYVEV